MVYVALFMVAIFMGGIKSNVVTFGADQFTHASENAKQSFFNWFYFSINVGSMISFTAIAYLQSYDFVIGLGVPALVMFVSAIFFFLGSSWYNKFPPAGSTLSKILSILYYCFTASPDIKRDAPSFLDRAKHVKNIQGFMLFEEEEVDDVKSLVRLLPIFSTFIINWCLYAQMSSVMLIQGVVMRLEIFPNFSIPPATLQAFNSAGILILLPLFDRVIYPCLRRLSISFSPLRRIGIGYLFSTLAIFYAGGLEVWRISYLRDGNVLTQHINGVPTEAANLSVLYQIPAFLGIGIGEVFASVTGLEFAYSQAPSKMKSMVQAINMLTIALGNYFGTLVVFIVNAASAPHPWITDDPNESHMDLYFFTLTVLGILNIYYFIWLSSKWSD
uniref:Major facilitator superfamily (MFS) profile domain-containing protein n=1 Tax=Arcella intermedia TaxID=1963864 RepID=A0A6B2L6S2_9EUKA